MSLALRNGPRSQTLISCRRFINTVLQQADHVAFQLAQKTYTQDYFPASSFSMTRAPPAIRRTCSPDPFRSFFSACSGVYVPFKEGEILPRVNSAL